MPNTDRIRELNDSLRSTLAGGTIQITGGVYERPDRDAILWAVKNYGGFSENDGPENEHNFGGFEIGLKGEDDKVAIVWQIDAYSLDLEGESPDRSDPSVTHRFLTIALAEELGFTPLADEQLV